MIGLLLATVATVALIRAPRAAAFGLVFLLVTVDAMTVDFTTPVALALYQIPPEIAAVLPATMAPAGIYAILLSIRLGLQRSPDSLSRQLALPRLAWLVPVVVVFGLFWGVVSGGAFNVAYHESRGLLVAVAVFLAVRAMRPSGPEALQRLVILSSSSLAIVVILRYFVVTRGRLIGEGAYAHESVLFLGIGVVVGILGFAQARNMGSRGAFFTYVLLLAAATICTGRRAGTLVLLVALVMIFVLLFFRRPMWVLTFGTAFVVGFGLYLSAYWNTEFGAMGQPARAIRSQFSPSQRDYSSDIYRLVETYNVTQTIRTSPLLGVGLGRPFTQYAPLWVAPNWPLQFFVPHDNLLWFWLKFGLPGLAVFGGLWAIAVGNAIRAARTRADSNVPVYPIALAASLMMYLQFMQVDVIASERAMIPLAILMALSLSLVEPLTEPAVAPARVAGRPTVRTRGYLAGASAGSDLAGETGRQMRLHPQ